MATLAAVAKVVGKQHASAVQEPSFRSTPLDVSAWFNNKAAAPSVGPLPNGSGFVNGSFIPSGYLPRGTWVDDGVEVSTSWYKPEPSRKADN